MWLQRARVNGIYTDRCIGTGVGVEVNATAPLRQESKT